MTVYKVEEAIFISYYTCRRSKVDTLPTDLCTNQSQNDFTRKQQTGQIGE